MKWVEVVGRCRESDAKDRFNKHYKSLLAQWGVKDGHWGTCILSTAQWQALDPVKLASTITYANCPEPRSDRLVGDFPSLIKNSTNTA